MAQLLVKLSDLEVGKCIISRQLSGLMISCLLVIHFKGFDE